MIRRFTNKVRTTMQDIRTYGLRPFVRLLIPLTVLTGCAFGPNYQRPEHLVPATFRATPGATQQDDSSGVRFATTSWWKVFKDPQLQTLITVALENNQDLKIATARIEEVRAALGMASADRYPQLNASGTGARERTPDSLRSLVSPPSATDPDGVRAPARNNFYSALLDLSYEVDLWGRVRRSREAARAELLASEEARDAVISSLITEVARSYFTLLELDKEVAITSATLRARTETLELIELRYEYGIASNLEVNRYRAEVAGANAAMSILRQHVSETENALSILLGQAPQAIRRGMTFDEQPSIPTVPVGLPSELLELRPDLRAAEQQLAAATARIGAAKAAFFPRIALTAEYGYQSLDLENLLESNRHGWLIAGNVLQPIFQGGRLWFNYKATKARQERALQNYRKTILQALREVSDALVAKRESGLELAERVEQVDALQNSRDLSNERYLAGQSSYLELLTTEQELFAAELVLERARLSELLSSVLLYKALGGGIEHER